MTKSPVRHKLYRVLLTTLKNSPPFFVFFTPRPPPRPASSSPCTRRFSPHVGKHDDATSTRARTSWVFDRATSLLEVWAIVAGHLGLVRAWRLDAGCAGLLARAAGV